MGLFDTNAREVISEHLKEALKGAKDLQELLQTIAEAMKRKIDQPDSSLGDGFPISWCNDMMEKALHIYNEVARCNGAALVRGTEKKEETT